MKVGIYSPYLSTGGGGERYFLTIAQLLSFEHESVELFGNEEIDVPRLEKRLGLDLSRVNYHKINFVKLDLVRRLLITLSCDVFFFLSDGSIPLSLSRNSILHFQTPFSFPKRVSLWDRLKMRLINAVICNSNYTKKYIDESYGVTSRVIYPPVDVSKFRPLPKENVIISVGRFFAPSHPKKQEFLIKVFQDLEAKTLPGWKLVLIGVVRSEDKEKLEKLRGTAQSAPIEFRTEINFEDLVNSYGRAKIYWHAAGFGEDLAKDPTRAEHFGITTVEAMASGCVPVVYPAGGQKEIVVDGESGFYWHDTAELELITRRLCGDEDLRRRVALSAAARSRKYGLERFKRELDKIL